MNLRPDILFVAHRVPYPPDKGDRIRTYHLLRFLAQYAHVHLAALADESTTADAVDVLGKLCKRVAIVPVGRWHRLRGMRSLALGGSASEGAFRSRQLGETIRTWAAGTPFAGAIASASSVAHYLKTPGLERTRRVVDFVDVDSQKWSDYAASSRPPIAWVYSLESRRLRRLERKICTWATAVTLVSEAEARMIREATDAVNVYSVTNGVDLDYYRPAPVAGEAGCVFVGALDYFPNVEGICWFARTVWPNVRQWHPEARLSIVGRKPIKAVLELQAIPGVDVVGQVPDVRPYLARAAVAVAPLRIARGLQNKVLEAMAAAKPVIATPAALAGFGNRPDLPAWPVTEVSEWIAVITSLLDNEAERRRLGHEGRIYAETHHNWSNCLKPFFEILGLGRIEAAGVNS